MARYASHFIGIYLRRFLFSLHFPNVSQQAPLAALENI